MISSAIRVVRTEYVSVAFGMCCSIRLFSCHSGDATMVTIVKFSKGSSSPFYRSHSPANDTGSRLAAVMKHGCFGSSFLPHSSHPPVPERRTERWLGGPFRLLESRRFGFRQRFARRQPASRASACVQNQRSPFRVLIFVRS